MRSVDCSGGRKHVAVIALSLVLHGVHGEGWWKICKIPVVLTFSVFPTCFTSQPQPQPQLASPTPKDRDRARDRETEHERETCVSLTPIFSVQYGMVCGAWCMVCGTLCHYVDT